MRTGTGDYKLIVTKTTADITGSIVIWQDIGPDGSIIPEGNLSGGVSIVEDMSGHIYVPLVMGGSIDIDGDLGEDAVVAIGVLPAQGSIIVTGNNNGTIAVTDSEGGTVTINGANNGVAGTRFILFADADYNSLVYNFTGLDRTISIQDISVPAGQATGAYAFIDTDMTTERASMEIHGHLDGFISTDVVFLDIISSSTIDMADLGMALDTTGVLGTVELQAFEAGDTFALAGGLRNFGSSAGDFAGALTVAGDLSGFIQVLGNMSGAARIDIGGDIRSTGGILAGGDIAGSVSASGDLNGVITSSTLTGSIAVMGGMGSGAIIRATDGPIAGTINIGGDVAGLIWAGNATTDTTADLSGTINVSGQLASTGRVYAYGGSGISGTVKVGSGIVSGGLIRAFVGGMSGLIEIGGDVYGAGAIYIGRTTADTAANLSGTINLTGGANLHGGIRVYGTTGISGAIVVDGNMGSSGSDVGYIRTYAAGSDLSGTIDIGENIHDTAYIQIVDDLIGTLRVRGNVSATGTGATGGVGIYIGDAVVAGSLDTTFGGDGKVTTDFPSDGDAGSAVAIQSDGKIVVAGWTNNGTNDDFALIRYNSDGSLDATFDGDGKVATDFGGTERGTCVVIQSDGKIVVAGYAYTGSYYDFAVARYGYSYTFEGNIQISGNLNNLTIGGSFAGLLNVGSELSGTIEITGDANAAGEFQIGSMSATGKLLATLFGDVEIMGDFLGQIGDAGTGNGAGTLQIHSGSHTINGWVIKDGNLVNVSGEDLSFNGAFAVIDDLDV